MQICDRLRCLKIKHKLQEFAIENHIFDSFFFDNKTIFQNLFVIGKKKLMIILPLKSRIKKNIYYTHSNNQFLIPVFAKEWALSKGCKGLALH